MRIINLAYVIVALSVLISIYYYPILPDQVVSHWGINGEPNGYASKTFILALVPGLSILFVLLFLVLPRIDPMKENIAKFRNYYQGIIVLLVGFLLYLQIITIVWNLGFQFQMIQALAPALAVLFYVIGVTLQHSKRNWFLGIRTPWTLSSDAVWEKTHRIGGHLFKLSGLIALLGVIYPQYALPLIIIPIIATAIYTTVYSYFEYAKIKGSIKEKTATTRQSVRKTRKAPVRRR